MNKKRFNIILILSICVFIGSLYKYAIGTGIRLDLFLFYDHPKNGRLLSNILKDIADMITLTSILLLWYKYTCKKIIKKAILPFLIISLIDIADYFLFYKQMSFYKLPLLLILTILFNLKCQLRRP